MVAKYNRDRVVWWLRSHGSLDDRAACVFGEYGNVRVDFSGYYVGEEFGVRPALKLNLESVIFSSESNKFTVGSATEEKKPNEPDSPDTPETPAKTVDMYRLYNPNSGEHFYTANAAEKDNLVSLGWKYEGVGWKAPATSNTPVYRVYNPNAGDHHYTTNKAEKDFLVSVGWNDEGIGWYSDDAKSVALYRQYNPNAVTGAHNFTSSKGENDWLVSVGWNGEGIGWYGVK